MPDRPASVEPVADDERRGPGRLVVRRLESMPLTARLLAILLALLLFSLTMTSLSTSYLMRRDLTNNIDSQLANVAEPVANELLGYRDETTLPSNYVFAYMKHGTDSIEIINPTSEPSDPAIPYLPASDARVTTGRPFTVSSVDGTVKWRLVAGRVTDGSATFAVGLPLSSTEHTVGRLITVTTLIGLLVTAACAYLGSLATRRAFRPLRKVEDVAAAIAAGDLSQRVPVRTSHDEVASLSDSLNAMLARVEHSFAAQEASEIRMRQFVADASHELRTPLATVRGYAELYRQGAIPDRAGLDSSMQRIEGEASRMSVLVDDLLTLARLDDERPLERTDVDLLVLVAEAAHDARARDPERAITVVPLRSELAPVLVHGDESRLRQVLGNLLTNALMHSGEGAPIEVALGTDGSHAVVEVRDHGVGLDEASAARVFERFYRADKARSRAKGGSGLGLAIVAAIVEQHQGDVEVDATPGGGATFRLRLPVAPGARGAGADR